MPYLAFNLNNGKEFVFDLVDHRHSLGRNPRNEIVIENIFISNFHAELLRQADGTYEIIDLKSSGGTFVNENRIDSVVLSAGDTIRFGELQARYGVGDPARSERETETKVTNVRKPPTGATSVSRAMGDLPPADPEAKPPAPFAAPIVPTAQTMLPGFVPPSLVAKAPALAAAMDAGLAEERDRVEKQREVERSEPAGAESPPADPEAKAGEPRSKGPLAELAQLARTKNEVAAMKVEMEKSKQELESVLQQLAERKAAEQSTRERLEMQSHDTCQTLARLAKDLKQVEERLARVQSSSMPRTGRFFRFAALTLLVLAAAGYWIYPRLPVKIKARLAARVSSGLAAFENWSLSQEAAPAATVAPVPVDPAPVEVSSAAPPITSAPAPAPPALGEDLSPTQRELVLLKERNRLTAYADEAIATGARTSYERLLETFDDPRLSDLVHAARSEVLRVQSSYLSGSRIDRFDIPVATYFPEDKGMADNQLNDGQLIKLLGDATNPWEVRMKAANLLGTRHSREAGDALVQAVRADAHLDVVKEATFSFDQMTGYHGRIFDAAPLEEWWKQHKANSPPPKPIAESSALKDSKPRAGSDTRVLTTP